MYKVPLADLKAKIVESGKLTPEELESKIKTKINELSGLISEEGAAHIIANELGVQVLAQGGGVLKIKEIYAGMKDISTVGKVVRKFDVREFARGESTGKVCSLVLGDETGTVRVVFWNEQVDQLSSVNEGDILAVNRSYARENNNRPEVHLGKFGDIDINPEGVVVGEVREGPRGFIRKGIKELEGGEQNVEVLGTVVQVFDPRFFHVHPETGKRIREGEEGDVVPALSYVLNAVIDDGTGNIRCVFWKNQTNHLLGKDENIMKEYKENLGAFQDIKTDLLGEQFKLMGRVQRNDMFDRLELNVQLVEKAKPEEELKKLEAQ